MVFIHLLTNNISSRRGSTPLLKIPIQLPWVSPTLCGKRNKIVTHTHRQIPVSGKCFHQIRRPSLTSFRSCSRWIGTGSRPIYIYWIFVRGRLSGHGKGTSEGCLSMVRESGNGNVTAVSWSIFNPSESYAASIVLRNKYNRLCKYHRAGKFVGVDALSSPFFVMWRVTACYYIDWKEHANRLNSSAAWLHTFGRVKNEIICLPKSMQ